MEEVRPVCVPTHNPQQTKHSFNNGISFDSCFDSGNLLKVEQVTEQHYYLWISPDCYSTLKQNNYRSWFHFSIEGTSSYNQTLTFTIKNMSFQMKLFRDGMQPVYRKDSWKVWERVKGLPINEQNGNMKQLETCLEISFKHEFESSEKVFFAFCHPYPYKMLQENLKEYQIKYQNSDQIYFHRNLLTYSKENRRIDLLVISSFKDIKDERMKRIPQLFPESQEETPFLFNPNKKAIFLSTRVHPGEVPGQHNFNGALKFLLSLSDQKAQVLRDNFVFYLVPMINPDGVYRGHYRTDAWGQNLNRYYIKPSFIEHPEVYAIKEVVTQLYEQDIFYGYIDFHSHASRKGCFIYGNHSDFRNQIQICQFCRILSLNTPYFEYDLCNFTEKNMYSKDKSDMLSKEGSGRVALFKQFKVNYCYTVESSYNRGNVANKMYERTVNYQGSDKNDYDPELINNPINLEMFPTTEHYTVDNYENIGEGCLETFLDLNNINPHSRIPNSPYKTLSNMNLKMALNLMKIPPFRFDLYLRKIMRAFQGTSNLTKPCRILFNYIEQDIKEEPQVIVKPKQSVYSNNNVKKQSFRKPIKAATIQPQLSGENTNLKINQQDENKLIEKEILLQKYQLEESQQMVQDNQNIYKFQVQSQEQSQQQQKGYQVMQMKFNVNNDIRDNKNSGFKMKKSPVSVELQKEKIKQVKKLISNQESNQNKNNNQIQEQQIKNIRQQANYQLPTQQIQQDYQPKSNQIKKETEKFQYQKQSSEPSQNVKQKYFSKNKENSSYLLTEQSPLKLKLSQSLQSKNNLNSQQKQDTVLINYIQNGKLQVVDNNLSNFNKLSGSPRNLQKNDQFAPQFQVPHSEIQQKQKLKIKRQKNNTIHSEIDQKQNGENEITNNLSKINEVQQDVIIMNGSNTKKKSLKSKKSKEQGTTFIIKKRNTIQNGKIQNQNNIIQQYSQQQSQQQQQITDQNQQEKNCDQKPMTANTNKKRKSRARKKLLQQLKQQPDILDNLEQNT